MRIMLGVHQFLPDFYAGTEKLTFDTAAALIKRGHEVRVFSGYAHPSKDPTPPYFDHYNYKGIPVDRYYYSRKDSLVSRNVIKSSYDNLRVVDGFTRSVTTFSPDIVHFYHLQRLSCSVVDVCKKKNIPSILTATDYWVVCPTHQLLLPDLSLCPGPENPPVNCLKHLCMASRSSALRWAARLIPNRVVKAIMQQTARHQWLAGLRPISSVQALVKRNDFLRKRLAHIDKVLVATQFMKTTLAGWGIPFDKIVYLPFSVSEADFEGREMKKGGDVLQIGFIGTLYDYKGAHILLKAFRKIPPEMPMNLKIYGDFDQFPTYVKKLYELAEGDPRIVFCGTFEPDRIGKVLQDLDLLVVPSLWHENTPLVIHTAMGAGVPVLGSNVSGINEVIRHESNGMLFERGNSDMLSNGLKRLCKDRQLLKKLSDNCKPLIKFDDYIDTLEQLYGSV